MNGPSLNQNPRASDLKSFTDLSWTFGFNRQVIMICEQEPPHLDHNGRDSHSSTSDFDTHNSYHPSADWMPCGCQEYWCYKSETVFESHHFSDQKKTLIENSPVESGLNNILSSYSNHVKSLKPVWVGQLGSTSGQWFYHPLLGPSAVGIKGIYGCTVVVIVSEKGGYISHIWESPVFVDQDFNPTDDDSFTTNTFNALRDGTAYAQSVTALIGNDLNPGVLNAIYAPKVFVLTPFTTDWDRQKFGISTILRYQIRAEELAQRIAEIIPGSGGRGFTLGYTRTSQQASSYEPGVAGRVILEIEPFQAWLTVPYGLSSSSLQIGRWHLWVEDQLITYHDFWIPDITAPGGCFPPQDSGYASLCSSHTNSP